MVPGAAIIDVVALHVPDLVDAASRELPILAPDERERAARFRRQADRSRFVVGRVGLRRELGARLGADPATLRFETGRYGKPGLAGGAALSFNASHSGDWVLLAFGNGEPLGIDVEAIVAGPLVLDEYARALCAQELAQIATSEPAAQPAMLARTWVRKEAYLKAIGEGVEREPHRIRVGSDAAGRPAILRDDNRRPAPGPWRLRDLALDAGHAACIAWRGEGQARIVRRIVRCPTVGDDRVATAS